MKKYTWFAFIAFIMLTVESQAQTLSDALRLSSNNYLGTARTMGVGGAFGALGGDQGGIYTNPASLGTYYKGEFIVSPHFASARTETEFQGNQDLGNYYVKPSIFDFGFVFTNQPRASKWKTSNISIGYYKIGSYGSNASFSGSSEGSIVERFQERANGKTLGQLDNFEAGLAYDVGAIYDFDEDNFYSTDLVETQTISKNQSIQSKGNLTELSFAWAGNYDNKIHIGVGLGVPFIRYSEVKQYSEVADDIKSPFRTLQFQENLETSGTGINLKLGLIATPVQFLRIGLALQSPTAFNLEDAYSTKLAYSFVENTEESSYTSESPSGYFNYSFVSPWRATGSLAYLINAQTVKGFLTADVDYNAYTNGNFNLTNKSQDSNDQVLQDDLNDQIAYQLANHINLRLGAELAVDIYRIRAGYQLNASPYAIDEGRFFSGLSLGGGLRFENFFLDLAYRTNYTEEGYTPYQLLNQDLQPLVEFRKTQSYVMATLGFMFGS